MLVHRSDRCGGPPVTEGCIPLRQLSPAFAMAGRFDDAVTRGGSGAQGGKYETLETRKDGVKFTCSSLRAAATQLQSLSNRYDSCQAALAQQVGCAHGPEPPCHPDLHGCIQAGLHGPDLAWCARSR